MKRSLAVPFAAPTLLFIWAGSTERQHPAEREPNKALIEYFSGFLKSELLYMFPLYHLRNDRSCFKRTSP